MFREPPTGTLPSLVGSSAVYRHSPRRYICGGDTGAASVRRRSTIALRVASRWRLLLSLCAKPPNATAQSDEGDQQMMDFLKRSKYELAGATSGIVAGAVAGAKIGAGMGIASGGTAIAATVPLGIVGGALLGLAGSRLGKLADDISSTGKDDDPDGDD